jgi:hypothetical protein
MAGAQSCPTGSEESEARILHGVLVHHVGLRPWLGLRLSHPACGESEIELVFDESENWRRADSMRGCKIAAFGKLYYGQTGYYSADMALSGPRLRPDTACHQFPVKPDFSAMPIPTHMRAYHVSIAVDYRAPGSVTVKARNVGNSHLLEPWQAYADYWLTGSFDAIWIYCGKGFALEDPAQSPPSDREIFRDDPDLTGTVLQDISGLNVVTFSCRRKSSRQ